MKGIAHRTIRSGDVELHCATSGDESAPLVMLLHGFPARWSSWRKVMVDLASRGFFVVAPDLRGAGDSSKPAGTSAYAIGCFVEDIASIAAAFERPRIFLAGHDFGGGVAAARAGSAGNSRCRTSRKALARSVHFTFAFEFWGDREPHFDAALANPPADWVTNVRVEHLPNAGHWAPHEEPAAVSALLAGHFSQSGP